MVISELRIEEKENHTYLITDIDSKFSKKNKFWYRVEKKYGSWLTSDVYDAFLVASIWPCMCYNEDIHIKGSVSKKLYKNIVQYVVPLIKTLRPHYSNISITVDGFKDCQQNEPFVVGTGFSGGVDSFSTIYDKYENEDDKDYRINTLFFFHIGQYGKYGEPETEKHAKDHYLLSKKFADEIKLPFVYMDSNMFEFYKPHWEYDAGPLCRIASILVFQKVCFRYYVSGSYDYTQLCEFEKFKHLDDVSDPFIYLMLSTNACDIILDGSQLRRSKKTDNISNYEFTKRHLNVCVNKNVDFEREKNCSICHKCNRTLIILEGLGKLNEFENIFNIPKYKKQAFKFKCLAKLGYNKNPFDKDIIDFLKSRNLKVPPRLTAYAYILASRIKNKIARYL